MLAWSEGIMTVNAVRGNLWRHCRRRAIYWLLRSPSQTCHANPNLKSTGAGRYQLLSVGGMPTASSLAWKTSLRKVRTLWHCSRLRSVALTYDWSWWYPSGNRPLQQYLGFTAGRWLWSKSIRLTAWLQNSKKRAERSERLMHSRVTGDYLRSGYLHHRSPVMGWLIITVITLLPTKPSATKMPENWSWRTRQLLTCRCVSVMLLRSMQNTRRS